MIIRIYSTEYATPLSHERIDLALACLPPGMASSARRFRRWQDTYGYVFGKLLLMTALREQGLPLRLRDIQYTDYGRPYLPNGPDFNISHSSHRVICALADEGRVGIDLEKISPLSIEDFKDHLTPEEWLAITGASDPLQAFYHCWTAKESLSKADGRGLGLPLAALRVTPGNGALLNGSHWHLHPLTLFPGYAGHIASQNPADELFIKEITPTELIVNTL